MSLLHVMKMGGEVKGVPLFVEIPVHAESAPYLVMSNKKGLLWIERCFNTGVVRSALLKIPWTPAVEAKTSVEVVRSVRDRGVERKWGNVFPCDPKGINTAREYLKSYGFDDTEVLDHDQCPFVPVGSAVVVPKDRTYLGIVGIWGDNTHTVVVHNPSRGMVVLGDW